MKKLMLIFIIVCLCPLCVQASDFIFDKGITWDMTQKQILKLEKKAGAKVKSKNNNQAVLKAGYANNKEAVIVYNFTNKQLASVEYTLNYLVAATGDDLYYRDFRVIIDDLTASYGKPDTDDMHWKITDPTLKAGFENQNRLGMAASLGYFEASASWKLKDRGMDINVLLFSPKQLQAAIKVSYNKLQ